MARASSRQKILQAAEGVVARDGGANLTLDAVAREAGVSKGGLLYHFPSKDALLSAILEEHVRAKFEAIEEQRAQCEAAGEPCSHLEAHIRSTDSMLCCDCPDREVGVALVAAISNNPGLLEPMQSKFNQMGDRIWGKTTGFDADAAMLWMASEGIRFFALLNHSPFLEGQREKLIARMIERAREVRLAADARQAGKGGGGSHVGGKAADA